MCRHLLLLLHPLLQLLLHGLGLLVLFLLLLLLFHPLGELGLQCLSAQAWT